MSQQDIITLIIRSEVEQALSGLIKVNTQMGIAKTKSAGFLDSMSKAKGVFMAAAMGAIALGTGLYKVVEASSKLEEATNYWEETFKGAQGTAKAGLDELTKSYAMSNREAMQLTAEVGSLARGLGLTTNEAAKMSIEVVKMAADWGSFKNIKTEDVLTAIRSGLVGETEPMRRFGVALSEATLQAKAMEMGLAKGKGTLDAKAKALAAYNIIAEKFAAVNAKGDMIRTAESWANQVKKFKANSEDFAAAIGNKVIPALQLYLKDVNAAMGADMGDKIGEIIGKFLLVIKAAYSAQQIMFSAIDYGIEKISEGINKVGVKFGELVQSETISNWFKQDLRKAENALFKQEQNMDSHFKKIDEIQKTWVAIEKTKTAKQYKDTEEGNKKSAQTMTADQAKMLQEKLSAQASFYTYTNNLTEAAIKQEEAAYSKQIQNAKQYGMSVIEIEKAHQKKLSELKNKQIEDGFKRGLDESGKLMGIQQNLMNGVFAVQNQMAKNTEIRLDQQNKFMDKFLEAQRTSFEQKFTERYSQLEQEKQQEVDFINATIADADARAIALQNVDKKYNDKKQALDNERGLNEKKMLEEQQRIREVNDARNMYLKHKEAVRQREMAFAQAVIAAFMASVQAFSSAMWLPFPANLIVGGVVAAATLATGLMLAGAIRNQPIPWLEEGGIVRGTAEGTLVRLGEKGKSEAVVPLEGERGREIMGSGGTTIVFNISNLYASEEVPRNMALAIDKALYKLQQDKSSLALR